MYDKEEFMHTSLPSLAVNIKTIVKPFDKILVYNKCTEWSKCFFIQKFCEKFKSCSVSMLSNLLSIG